MKHLCYVLVVATCYACTTGQADTKASDLALDSLAAATDPETIALDSLNQTGSAAIDADGADAEGTGSLAADGVYTITNNSLSVGDPFDFSLDTTTIRDLLGIVTFTTTEYPAGKDDYGGEYSAFTYYEAFSDKTTLSFYSYSGKHHADIYHPNLIIKNNIFVGITRQEFIDRMSLEGNGPYEAKVFTINDDYGSMSFYFDGDDKDALNRIYVYYEEGD
jgi:hypothetical protein